MSLESLGRHTVQMLHDVLDARRMIPDEAVRIYREGQKLTSEASCVASADDLHDGRLPRTSPAKATVLILCLSA